MEIMTASYAPSHLPPQSQSPRAHETTTRAVQPSDAHQQQQSAPHHPKLSAPASQESIVSVQSSYAGSIPQLHGSDSNLSQLTTYTDLTSPSSSAGLKYGNNTFNSQPLSQQTANDATTRRTKTPENGQQTPNLSAESALYSPMSITSPVATNGAKRTASGHVKNAHSITTSPYNAQFPGRDSRRESLSSSGSKAGEIAATLKARLGYAMAKVQNGWEHKSLAEVEQLAAERQRNRTSTSHLEQQRPGTSGLSNAALNLSMYDQYGRPMLNGDGPPPSKRTSGNYSHYQAQLQHQYASQGQAPRLQPAPDIRPTSSQRGAYTAGPILQPFAQHVNAAMSPPRTPANVIPPQRPATIRTETQTAEAEREALQALFQLGSPHTSVGPHIARTGTATTSSSQGQMSPTKSDLTPRHTFFARSESASTSSSGVDTNAQALQESRTRLIEQLAD
ncbi:putative transcription factor Nrm1/Whi5 [Septoria linicola]|nr:putative transcription factor Nrm1/Whi5 [Septoria linicola]